MYIAVILENYSQATEDVQVPVSSALFPPITNLPNKLELSRPGQ